MKKILSILLAATLVVTSLPAGNAYAFEGTDNSYSEVKVTDTADDISGNIESIDDISDNIPGNSDETEEVSENNDVEITYDADNVDEHGFVWNGRTIIDYTGEGGAIVIPADCKHIGENAFKDNATITSVTFEAGSVCEDIGIQAFYNCTALTSITFPESLECIDANAFYQTALTSVTIPENLKVIAAKAFYKNESLSSVTILSNDINITSVCYPYQAFKDCSISSITWGEKVNKVPARLFSEAGFAANTSIVIPKRFTVIGEGAFYNTNIAGLSFEEGSALTTIWGKLLICVPE